MMDCYHLLLMPLLVVLLDAGTFITLLGAYIPDELTIPVDHSLPRIRPLRRQVQNFEPGRKGEITVVYQTTHPDDQKLRWFRKSRYPLPNAELPDYLSTEGDPRYEYRYMSVNDVRAVTLKVKDVQLREFPMEFYLIITAGYPGIEYQLHTKIQDATPEADITYLDEIRWVALPGMPLIFSYHGFLAVTCVAVLDSESQSYLDELQLYRMVFDKETTRRNKRPDNVRGSAGAVLALGDSSQETLIGNITSIGRGEIHRDRTNYAEKAGPYTTIGSRSVLPRRYLRYEVTRRIVNATRRDEGAYACVVERAEDRSYASAWAREGRAVRPPALEVLPCTDNSRVRTSRRNTDYHYKVNLTRNRETCLRCRAYGDPNIEMVIIKEGALVVNDANHNVDDHVNVADGGIREVTYTIWQASEDDSGLYECLAYHKGREEKLKFRVIVK